MTTTPEPTVTITRAEYERLRADSIEWHRCVWWGESALPSHGLSTHDGWARASGVDGDDGDAIKSGERLVELGVFERHPVHRDHFRSIVSEESGGGL